MRNDTLVRPRTIEDNPICPRTPSRIGIKTAQNRKLIVRARARERETFVVVVSVRIGTTTDGLALSVVGVALLNGFVDGGLVVAGVAAGFDALARLRT